MTSMFISGVIMKDKKSLHDSIEKEFKKFLYFYWTLIALVIMTWTNIMLVTIILMDWI